MSWTRVFDRNKPWIKNPDSLVTVLFYDKIAIPLVYLFEKLNISPNFVSSIGIVLGLIGSWHFVIGNFTTGSLLFLLWFIFDCVDGKLARKTGKKTELGKDLDFLGGHIVTNLGYLSFVIFYLLKGKLYISLLTMALILYHHFMIVYGSAYRVKYRSIIKNVSSYFGPFDSGSIILISPIIFRNYWFGLLISNILYTAHIILGCEKIEGKSFSKNLRTLINKFFK